MKAPSDLAGDVPIRLTEHQFTLAEAASLAHVPEQSVRNWMHRDVLKIGEKHFLGRWMFNVLDVLRLVVMHDLCVVQNHNPKVAAKVAAFVVQQAMESSARDASGKLTEGADGFRPNRNVILNFGEGGEPFVLATDIRTPGNYYPPERADTAKAALRRCHVVIPVTALLHDVILATEDLTRRNAKAEAPVHE